MDGRGGCCIARGAHDMSTMNRIMLRFRPIAPKPTAAGTVSDGSSSESGDAFFKNGRVKRENNITNKRRIRRRKTVSSPEQKQPVQVVTLPLLPETPDLTLSSTKEVGNNNNDLKRDTPGWLSFDNRKVETCWCSGTMDPSAVSLGVFYSCVTVESLTDTWVEGEGLGSTDEERRVKMSKDTCPGFISDGYGRVTWTNGAYREMMGQGDEGVVLLVMKVSAVVPYTSFTCRVRVVQFVYGKERSSLTVPCDVWRMDRGGFAWRLDVKAALSLRLGS